MSPLILVLALQADEPLERFEHGQHQAALEAAELSCQGCHALGHPPEPGQDADAISLMPGFEVCHGCHQGEQRRRRAPTRCSTCHETTPAPTDHGAGWLDHHGTEARLGVQACEDCHRDSACVACHEDRESIGFQVHDRSWLAVHGVAARVQPGECATCHTQAGCLSCHASGVEPW